MKHRELIEKMTLEEKASLCSGADFWHTKSIERLGIPSLMLTDGPHGLRKQPDKADHLGLNGSLPATCFPTASALASSWDTELLEKVGSCIGSEAAGEDVSVVLGPGLNIKRDPLCGRNFEYFSEDPYLAGKLAAAMVRGIQSQGVSACVKHYAVNSQETRRMGMNEVVDERALREIYLEGFRYAVTEGKPGCLMTSYNRVNGVFANENMHLLRDILRHEWGYEGMVVTDWGGNNDRVAAIKAGCSLEMPSSGGVTDAQIVRAVKSGELEERLLDEAVDRYLDLLFSTRPALGKGKRFNYSLHHQTAREAAARCAVLLKNEGHILPVKKGQRIAVIGDFAARPRYQGAGSSLINPTRVDNALDALKDSGLDIVGYAQGFQRAGGKSEKLKVQALDLAEQADVCLLFLGLDESSESEGRDRSHMRLPENQLELLEALYTCGHRIVVVLSGGAPVEFSWADQAKAILMAYLGGQAGGGAIADLVSGKISPSGKLAESFPLCYSDCPTANYYPGRELSAEHRESIYVGYRYYDTAKRPVAFPFGHGLSYSLFEYSDLELNGNDLCFRLKNVGHVKAAEVTQVYVSSPDCPLFHPEKELKAFAKVELEPDEECFVRLSLDEHAFAHYSVEDGAWVTFPGMYKILVGSSSRDIRLRKSHIIEGEPTAKQAQDILPHYWQGNIQAVPGDEFAALLGRPLPPERWDKSAPAGCEDTISQGQYRKGLGRLMYSSLNIARKGFNAAGKSTAANNIQFIMDMPYNKLQRMSGGILPQEALEGYLDMLNGHMIKGGIKAIKAMRKKK